MNRRKFFTDTNCTRPTGSWNFFLLLENCTWNHLIAGTYTMQHILAARPVAFLRELSERVSKITFTDWDGVVPISRDVAWSSFTCYILRPDQVVSVVTTHAACWSVWVITVSVNKSVCRRTQGLAFQNYVQRKKSNSTLTRFPPTSQKWKTNLKKNGNKLFSLTLDSDNKLASFIISWLVSGVVRDKMSPCVKYALHTTLSNSWDNARVVSGDNCWPGHCCKVLSSVCESFDITGASYTKGRALNVWGK